MDSFAQILQRLPTCNTSSSNGGIPHFKVQISFNIPIFELELEREHANLHLVIPKSESEPEREYADREEDFFILIGWDSRSYGTKPCSTGFFLCFIFFWIKGGAENWEKNACILVRWKLRICNGFVDNLVKHTFCCVLYSFGLREEQRIERKMHA